MQTIKGIKFKFNQNPQLNKLLKDYRKAVNLFLFHCKITEKTSRKGVNEIRQKVRELTGLSGGNSVKSGNDALAIYRSYRKKKGSFPIAKKLSMKVLLGYNGKLENNRLRVTISRSNYIYLDLKLGKYQQKFLDLVKEGKIKLGEITITPNYCVFSVKKEYTPYQPEGILTLDINEQNILGLAMKGNHIEVTTWTLKPIYELNCKYFEMYRNLQKRYPNDGGLWKRVVSRWYRNRNNKKNWYLNNILNEIIKYAEINKLIIIEESLKGLKKGVNRKKLKKNKYNGEMQMHRKLPRKILGRLNRAVFSQIQFMLKYKSQWLDIPYDRVSSYGNSQTCPICGEKNKSAEWHKFECQCGVTANRHLVGCLNILKKHENEGPCYRLDRDVMKPILRMNIPV